MDSTQPLKIVLIGTRGVPANYGGFETCVEEIGSRLAQKGHSVTVYCRTGYYKEKLKSYRGMRLVYLQHIRKKSLDTLSHTLLSMLHAIFSNYDVYMVFNVANSPAAVIPRLLGKKIAINTDGLEWKRGKWGRFAKRFYLFSEWLSTKLANRIVADSPGIESYYREKYGVESSVIAYGAEVSKSRKPELIEEMELEQNGYFLQITRFEPENNPLLTIKAYKKLKTDKKLVLIGGVRYESSYLHEMSREKSENILMPGFIYDKELLNEIWCNCFAYIHGNEVGGTNPALLQAMASGCYTIGINVSFSHDVLQDCGHYFDKDPESLAERMTWALSHPEDLAPFKEKARVRIREFYSWDIITEQYEKMFYRLLKNQQGDKQSHYARD